MSLFNSCSGFEINGGDFYMVAGDMNLQPTQPTIEQNIDPLAALEFDFAEGPSRQLLGAERNGRHRGAERMLPYLEDISHRTKIPSSLQNSSLLVPDSEPWSSTAAIGAPLPWNSRPSSFPQSDREFMSLSSALIPMPSTIEETHWQPRLATSFHPSSTAVDSLQQPLIGRTDVDPISHLSTNFELPTSSHIDLFARNFGGFVAPINRPSWEEPVPHAPRTSINGGTFIGGNVNHIQRSGEPAGDATHNSEDRFSEPRCHPETRTKMLDVLWKWTSGTEPPTFGSSLDNPSSPILWLHGPAGAGKSAIAQSICQKLEDEARLGASFFFKRGHSSRGHAKRLCATIAYQLALLLPDLKRHISQSVENDPSLVDKSLEIQLQKLIIEPLRLRQTRMGATSTPGLIVVIDGLDECQDPKIQQRILLLIGRAVDKQQLPIRFLVASRPEPHICEIFSGALNGIHCPVNVEQSFEDVRRYLLDEFTRIHGEHKTMAMVPYPWPSQKMVDNLVWKSSGYFIYASTVVKFIDNKHYRPGERLEVITGMKEPDFESPFAALDQLYTEILSQVRARPLVLKILTVILAGQELLPSYIDQLLELEPGDVLLALRDLHSVIKITENRLLFHHNSFRDFLKDPARAGIFYVGGHSHQTDFCCHILRALSYTHDHPSLNRHGHVSWHLDMWEAFKFMASLEPTPGLVTMLRSFNPDFLFASGQIWCPLGGVEMVDVVLDWLKRSRPMPTDLIQVWEDYSFMVYCESGWAVVSEMQDDEDPEGIKIRATEEEQDNAYQILSQASPSLIRILHAIFPLLDASDSISAKEVEYTFCNLLFTIHITLDVSWDKLKTAICSLRPLMGNRAERRFIKVMSIVALDPTLFPPRFDSILWDLACGSLHVFRQVLSGEIDGIILYRHFAAGWSNFLRSCPPSSKLLEDVCFTESIWRKKYYWEAYNIVQWLKTFLKPPLELISQFEGDYLGGLNTMLAERDWEHWKERLKPYLDLAEPDRSNSTSMLAGPTNGGLQTIKANKSLINSY
ncbi:hypothetical protein GGX14DRAFT_646452 [Mycena pura]|uniref:Nephrocystin 3-like N-terminal domain-containing protein n=1 Tax=Mycena pura TaxID=153505 RepID=A0AAD6V843_9AGAR|nr:hypothetical protein GGX14DRAFT_646452 [Mycena pura]